MLKGGKQFNKNYTRADALDIFEENYRKINFLSQFSLEITEKETPG